MPTFTDAIFIDTGGWIALSDRGDQHHRQATDFWSTLQTRRRHTTSHVIAETYTFLRYNLGYAAASKLLGALIAAEAAGTLTIWRSTTERDRRAALVIERFADVKLSFANAFAFAILMDELAGCRHAFAFDEHFRLTGRILCPADIT